MRLTTDIAAAVATLPLVPVPLITISKPFAPDRYRQFVVDDSLLEYASRFGHLLASGPGVPRDLLRPAIDPEMRGPEFTPAPWSSPCSTRPR